VERENANAARATHLQQELAAAAPTTSPHAGNAAQGDDNVSIVTP
jgi:hypothetical protein